MERTRSIEDLHELRLMALLHDLVRKHQRKGAGEILGVDPRTVKACLEQGALSKWMRTALEAQLLSREKAAMAAQQERIEALDRRMEALEQQITSGLGEMRTTMEGEIKALKDEHAGGAAAVGAASGPGGGRIRRSVSGQWGQKACGPCPVPAAVSRAGDRRACSR